MLPHHPSWVMLEEGSINTAVYKTWVVVTLFRDCGLLRIHNASAKERYSTCVFSYFHVVIRQLGTRDYWVFGLCTLSGILRSTIFWKLDLFPTSGESVGGTYSFWSIRKIWHLSITGPWTMDKIQKLCSPKCYTPLSEPLRIELVTIRFH